MRLKDILQIIRAKSICWEVLVQTLIGLSENTCPTYAVCKTIEEMTADDDDSMNVFHLFTLYALFIDTMTCLKKNNHSISVKNEL